MNQVATINNHQITEYRSAAEIRAHVNVIQEVMNHVMQDGVHYGKLPGCGDKKSLFKPGAEKILSTFRLASELEVSDLSNQDECHLRVTVKLIASDGTFVGSGIGECSSNEEKYKWRAPVCQEEFDSFPENRRRVKWKKGWNGQPAQATNQVRTEVADIRNTVLKMAKKRALVDATLTCTAASDIFTQDIEDLPDEIASGLNEGYTQSKGKQAAQSAQRQSTAPAKLIKKLEDIALKGIKPLIDEWSSMTDSDRKAVGSEFGRIKKIAEANNAG